MTAKVCAVLAVVSTVIVMDANLSAHVRLREEHVHALKGWVEAVERHTPGETDGSVVMLERLLGDQVGLLRDALPFFVSTLAGRGDKADSAVTREIVLLARNVGSRGSWLVFVKRAMVLHSDVGIARITTKDAPPSPRNVPGTPALLVTRDGMVVSRASGDWNWLVGRELGNFLLATPGFKDPFVSNWYHIVSAVLLATRQYGELGPHLARAETALPNDALALFDRGCATEADGLPASQQMRDTTVAVGANGRRLSLDTNVPTQTAANTTAERLMRRALDVDPRMAEARVRLARLLLVRGKEDEAVKEAEAALALSSRSSPSPLADHAVEFYGHLIAARANRSLGHGAMASAHVDAALALYPNAQSALLEQSEIALMLADAVGAIPPIDRLSAIVDPIQSSSDPWWRYQLGAGRDAPQIIDALRASVR